MRHDEAQRNKDAEGAARAASLAARWETLAHELIRAIGAERRSNELQAESLELEQKIARARALLEETLARRGRAKAALDQLVGTTQVEKRP